jgi:hypothetical protein
MSNGSSAGEIFVQEFVIGFGFLSGLFVNVGVDPEGLIYETLLNALAKINPDIAWFGILFTILGVIVLIVTILGAYAMGGGIGLVAVFLAFLGGIFITTQIVGVILLIVAVVIGLFIGEMN